MNQIKRTNNKENIFWLTGVFFFVLIGSGVTSIYFLVQLNSELKQIVKEDIPITDMIAEITIHKLEQTSWFERALRHAEIVAHKRENNEDNLRLFGEAKDKFEAEQKVQYWEGISRSEEEYYYDWLPWEFESIEEAK